MIIVSVNTLHYLIHLTKHLFGYIIHVYRSMCILCVGHVERTK